MIKKKKRRANKNRVIYRELKDGQGEREKERIEKMSNFI